MNINSQPLLTDDELLELLGLDNAMEPKIKASNIILKPADSANNSGRAKMDAEVQRGGSTIQKWLQPKNIEKIPEDDFEGLDDLEALIESEKVSKDGFSKTSFYVSQNQRYQSSRASSKNIDKVRNSIRNLKGGDYLESLKECKHQSYGKGYHRITNILLEVIDFDAITDVVVLDFTDGHLTIKGSTPLRTFLITDPSSNTENDAKDLASFYKVFKKKTELHFPTRELLEVGTILHLQNVSYFSYEDMAPCLMFTLDCIRAIYTPEMIRDL
jgi:hypothetical protein